MPVSSNYAIFLAESWPNELADKSNNFNPEFKDKSLKNLDPALSSNLLSLRYSYYNDLLIFNACDKYLDPSYPILLLVKFRDIII